ncbi:MAG: hypothetical protein OER59_02205, partial [Desulfobulbaceae bacterium]|nr:hypothetical protein [Desulfobulbaceae bacterium]
MKKLIYICISCMLGVLLLTETSAASICDTEETVVFFGNGIKTAEKKAYDARNVIKQRLKEQL